LAESQTVAPADLLIDEENPRIEQPNAGQHKALQSLAQHLGPKLPRLAEDIVRNGTDPSSLPIVTPLDGNPGRFIVLEGNRRLAALRALENPEGLADVVTPQVLRRLRQLSREYQDSPIEALACVVVRSRDDARHWIELRHTGENLGAGVVPWGSDEVARFRARGGVVLPRTQALDFLERRGDLSVDLRRRVPASTLERLLENPAVREALGLQLSKGQLFLTADDKLVARALLHVVNDLASGRVKVSALYKKDQLVQYAQELPKDIAVPAVKRTTEAVPISSAGQTGRPKPGTPVARIPKKRDRLIPRDCVLSIPAGRVRDIESELRKLSLEEHTNAVSVLFRVFIELSVDAYIAGQSLPTAENAALQKKMSDAVSDLVTRTKLTAKQATPVRRACQRDSFLAPSVTLLHNYVHNDSVFPAPADLRAYWDSLQPFIAALWVK